MVVPVVSGAGGTGTVTGGVSEVDAGDGVEPGIGVSVGVGVAVAGTSKGGPFGIGGRGVSVADPVTTEEVSGIGVSIF
ncbi:hypothetical protein M1563_02135 [Patescibacteria group bacterium]|nr:hypothetical protein [Patescibacteria group bacterium]MCL5410088.1 hypothetical protein [Patescibacteria group bacterium]